MSLGSIPKEIDWKFVLNACECIKQIAAPSSVQAGEHTPAF